MWTSKEFHHTYETLIYIRVVVNDGKYKINCLELTRLEFSDTELKRCNTRKKILYCYCYLVNKYNYSHIMMAVLFLSLFLFNSFCNVPKRTDLCEIYELKTKLDCLLLFFIVHAEMKSE